MSQVHANGPAGHTSAPPKAAQAGGKAFSNAAKKDPALLPLALVIGGAAAYFFSTKATGSGDPAKKFAPLSQPWEGNDKEGSPLYKYRYMGKGGKIERHMPATSYETVPMTGNDKLRKFNLRQQEENK